MPTILEMTDQLESIVAAVAADSGLTNRVSAQDLAAGFSAIRELNAIIAEVLSATGMNDDGVLSPTELAQASQMIQSDPVLNARFVAAHGDDEGNIETGFHVLQNDGGKLEFQGRALIDTVVDAVFHVGFDVKNGRFVNEDGNQNERVVDVARWLNYFLNGRSYVFGDAGGNELFSGKYSGAIAGAANETFDAGAGDDHIWADGGNDIVLAGDGNDVSSGGTGNDQMFGGNGDDELWGDKGSDTIDGQDGNDDIGGAQGWDRLSGGVGDDCIWGESGNDSLDGGIGNDMMGGGKGDDITYGGAGDDKIFDDFGSDFIDAGDGNDKVGGGHGADTMLGGAGNDEIWDDYGNDKIDGGLGNDTLGAGRGFNVIDGDAGNDKIHGGRNAEILRGGDDSDEIHGNHGADIIEGGAGNDVINAGEGADIVMGGIGADKMTLWDNSSAVDTLVFAPGDTGTTASTVDIVEGFTIGEDKIDLRAFGPLAYTHVDFVGGTGSFYFDGSMLRIDNNGDRLADAMIEFRWIESLKLDDFLLA